MQRKEKRKGKLTETVLGLRCSFYYEQITIPHPAASSRLPLKCLRPIECPSFSRRSFSVPNLIHPSCLPPTRGCICVCVVVCGKGSKEKEKYSRGKVRATPKRPPKVAEWSVYECVYESAYACEVYVFLVPARVLARVIHNETQCQCLSSPCISTQEDPLQQ